MERSHILKREGLELASQSLETDAIKCLDLAKNISTYWTKVIEG